MCIEDDELPPFPPVRGGADSYGDLTLTASDGVEFSAVFAHPNAPSNRAVVILPDIRAMGQFYKDLAVGFAEAGLHAVTIDYYTRAIGRGPRPLPDEEAGPAKRATNNEDVDRDIDAAAQWLRALPGVQIDSIFTVGFCLGGTYAWHQSARGQGLNGHVSLYGVPIFLDDARVEHMSDPILMLIAGQDRTPPENVFALAERIRGAGGDVETHLYEVAPHGYFSRTGEFGEECDDSWARMLDFFERHASPKQ